MSVEIDHIFVKAARNAPESDLLRAFGLREGSSNTHPGQGTANRRFFVRNAMLELLWISDEDEIRSDGVARTRLYERLRGLDGASPFGVCLRAVSGDHTESLFPAWEYRPPYLPKDTVIHIGLDTPVSEPLWFYFDFAGRPDGLPDHRQEPLDHPCGFQELSAARIFASGLSRPSTVAQALISRNLVELEVGESHLVELGFDGEREGRREDFRPTLPLIFSW